MAAAAAAIAGHRGWLWLTALGLMLAATATRAELEFTSCELRGSQGHGRVAAFCATFERPENPDEPDGRTLSLQVARIPSLNPNPPADAFTLINGGPGGSSISLYVDMQFAFASVLRERDIVLLDQRGTGRSHSLGCPDLDSAAQEFDPGVIRAATRRCLDRLDADPRFFTTSAAVTDLEALRRELGISRWNLYGVSYGTRVAQQYLRRHPDAVRTLVLDGVLPMPHSLGPDIALNAQAALDTLIARCHEDRGCRERFPDPAAQIRSLREQLRLKPHPLDLPHPVTGRREHLELRPAHLAMTVRLLSYAPETAALIPLILDEAAARDNYLPVAAQALRIESDLAQSISFGMHNSVVCTEDVPFYGELDGMLPDLAATYLGADQVRALTTICELWPAGFRDADLKAPLDSALPTLLLSGENDPITPPAYAEQAATGYRNHRHIVARGQGHGIVGRGCLPRLLGEFVAGADPAALDTVCVDRLRPDPFFVNLLGPVR